jgi:hypothetical protein
MAGRLLQGHVWGLKRSNAGPAAYGPNIQGVEVTLSYSISAT